MGRLNRAETQERNRARVLAAARAEFAERGFRDAKIDVIAERAELTRGAVYSNFPGKRALYLAVLAEDAERAADLPDLGPGRTVRSALAAFATAWLARPAAGGRAAHRAAPAGRRPAARGPRRRRLRAPFAQLTQLQAVVLGLALERLRPAPGGRLVRVGRGRADHPARRERAVRGGAGLRRAVRRRGGLRAAGRRRPGRPLGPAAPALRARGPPGRRAVGPAGRPGLADRRAGPAHRRRRASPSWGRTGSARSRRRCAPPPAADVTAVLVSGQPAELLPLARLVVADLRRCLRRPCRRGPGRGCGSCSTRPARWPRPPARPRSATRPRRPCGSPAAAIVARAEGHGACHAAATA